MQTSIEEQLVESILNIADFFKKSACFDSELTHLSIRELQVLVIIKNSNKAKMQEIASYLKITMPTATVFIDQLIKKELVKRDRDIKDRRAVCVELTDKGKSLLKKAMEKKKEKINKTLSYLSLKEKKDLHKIIKNLLIRAIENEEKK